MAYTDNFPQRPVFMADFANGGKIDPRATFTRASTGTFFGTEKVLSSENLLLQSEDFTTSWGMSEGGGAAGATAPDGGTDAYTITCYTASSKSPRLNQSLSGKLSANTQYTMVGHVKAGTATHGYISFRGTNSGNYAYAQIEFASPGSVSTGGAGFSGISGTVTALGSSWYKLTLTATTGSDVSGAFAFLGPNDGSAFGVSGYPIWDTAGETLEVWGAQISSTNTKVYDSPTTTQIARSYQTKLQTAASGAARFEHSATDGQSMGLLVESQATSLVTYSEDSTQWNAANSSVQSNAAVAPDGTTAATYWKPNTATNAHYLYHGTVSVTSGTTYTGSVFLKGVNTTRAQVTFGGAGFAGGYVNFSLTGDGSVLTEQAGATGTISSCGNGWYRVTITAVADATTTTTGVTIGFITSDTEARLQYSTQNGYDGLLVTGFQFETGSFASSYLKSNSGSTTTRAADSLSVATADIGYTGGDVSLVFEGDFIGDSSGTPHLFSLRTDASNRIEAFRNPSDDKLKVFAKADNVLTASATASAFGIAANTKFKFGVAYGDNCNSSTDSDAGMPEATGVVAPNSTSHLYVGQTGSGSHLDGHCAKIALYSSEISKTSLQAITS